MTSPDAGTFIIVNCTENEQHFLKNSEENAERLLGLYDLRLDLGVVWLVFETVHGAVLHVRADTIKNWTISQPSMRTAFYDFRELLKEEDIDEVSRYADAELADDDGPFTGLDDGDEWKRTR